jgi:hypothetical protein
MPKIESADQATEIADGFLKKYYQILQRPLSARPEQGKWVGKSMLAHFLPSLPR